MNFTLPYGAKEVSGALPWAHSLGVLAVNSPPPISNISGVLEQGLTHPVGMNRPLNTRFKPGESALIVVSDASRATGAAVFLPPLIQWLGRQGVAESDMAFLIALGVHRPATRVEQERIFGSHLFRRFQNRIFNHDAHNPDMLLYAGKTSRGTEVFFNRLQSQYDHVILTGTVVMHYFAGFGGGRKALMPGIAGADSIAHNHVLNLHPSEGRLNPCVRIGVLDGNPVAEDMLEAARLYPPAFILNTVLDGAGRIAGLFVGELDAAHRRACAFAETIQGSKITKQADLVVASVAPASNFIQSHKALFNAYSAMKPGGRIVLLTPAREGLGSPSFRRYLEAGSPSAVIAALRHKADINGQTALSTLQKGPSAILVTEMAAEDVALLGARKAHSLDHALSLVYEDFQQAGVMHPTCLIMPDAAVTVPLRC